MKIRKFFVLFLLLLTMAFNRDAQAAKMAKVIVDSAKVFAKPQLDSEQIDQVTKDTSVPVSNNQTNGFYKTKSPSGKIGWVSGNDVLAGESISTPAPVVTKSKESVKPPVSGSNDSRVIFSGGLNILNNSGFPSTIPNTDASMALGGTFEIQFMMGSKFALCGRAEYLTKSSTQQFTSGITTFDQSLTFSSLPLMAGIQFFPVNEGSVKWGVGAYGGVSMFTTLSALRTSALSTTESGPKYSSSDLTGYFNTNVSFALGSKFGIITELGYRLHQPEYPAYSENAPIVAAFSPSFGGLVTRLGFVVSL